ncbi:uncharacterized protein K02A2.6-like [Uranotaenia lowii]|uniref:uncharacterized protein K02A2.6-like n=1 Tax=Uranotaenia lowii TaxID=190385 RepID=UPI002478C28E|nr:uncharacterized protein K02A2.6-like [Uranotaenia lowii]
MHFVRECPFTKHLCKSCGKTGHKEGYCNCLSANSGLRRNFIDVSVNGVYIELQFETASDITVISKPTWKKLGSPPLQPTLKQAKSASGKPLQFVGEIHCDVTMGNQTKFGTCYVTNQPSLNLFGLDWIELFGLWSFPLSSICHKVQEDHSKPIQQYKKAFPKVFANSLGHCTKTRVKLFLKPDARPVLSPNARGIVVVQKASGKVRICTDYSTSLNAALEPHNYPLPVPDGIFTKLNGSKVFSIIDLSDAYLQVEVDDELKKLLTINTHRGLYRFNRLAPGVKSAPGAFQQLMNGIIANDIIIFSKTESDHHKRLRALFNRLCEYGFRSS